jgi:hypothetical protein
MKKRDSSVAITELLTEGVVEGARSPGAVVDYLAENGDAVVVDPLGRLAVHPAYD